MKKTYVKVIVETNELGNKRPITIFFDDKKFNIDRVLDMKKCASLRVGGVGERYTVRIGNCTTFLYFENTRWFVEEK